MASGGGPPGSPTPGAPVERARGPGYGDVPVQILPMLLARSRHASIRSLERYARPGPEAVARMTAESDPARRRR
jgi:hypothetical protein